MNVLPTKQYRAICAQELFLHMSYPFMYTYQQVVHMSCLYPWAICSHKLFICKSYLYITQELSVCISYLYVRAICTYKPFVHKSHLYTRAICTYEPFVHKNHLYTSHLYTWLSHLYTWATCSCRHTSKPRAWASCTRELFVGIWAISNRTFS